MRGRAAKNGFPHQRWIGVLVRNSGFLIKPLNSGSLLTPRGYLFLRDAQLSGVAALLIRHEGIR
jgi:hypothetical protein